MENSMRQFTPEFGSETWLFVEQWAESEISKARVSNELLRTGPDQTIMLRSKIKVLKDILNLNPRRATAAKFPAMSAGEGPKNAR